MRQLGPLFDPRINTNCRSKWAAVDLYCFIWNFEALVSHETNSTLNDKLGNFFIHEFLDRPANHMMGTAEVLLITGFFAKFKFHARPLFRFNKSTWYDDGNIRLCQYKGPCLKSRLKLKQSAMKPQYCKSLRANNMTTLTPSALDSTENRNMIKIRVDTKWYFVLK